MRRVWSRNTPRSGGIVALVAEQVLEHRRAGAAAGGCPARPGRAAAGSPSRTRLRAAVADRERVGERDLAGLVDDQVVERLVHAPRCANSQAVPATSCTSSGGREVVVVVGALDEVAARTPTPRRPRSTSSARGSRSPRRAATRSTSSSRLWIALWLFAVTPTRLPAREQVDDQVRAGVGLAGAGRALDEEVAVVEAERRSAWRARGRRTRPGAASPARAPRRRGSARWRMSRSARYGPRRRARRAIDVRREPPQRRALRAWCRTGRPGISARGSGSPARFLPRLSLEPCPRSSSIAARSCTPLSGRRVDRVGARARACAPARGTRACRRAIACRLRVRRRPTGVEVADRLGVLDELVGGHARGARRTPTRPAWPRGGGSRAAAPAASARCSSVALGEVVGHAGEQRVAQRDRSPRPPRARSSVRSRSSAGAHGISTPNCASPRAALEQPVAQHQRRVAVLLVVVARSRRGALRRPSRATARTRRSSRRPRSRAVSRCVHVEGLDLLDRVARLRDPQRPARRPVEVDEHARCAAARRPRPRACRAGPSAA